MGKETIPCVYSILDPRCGTVFYIGQTRDLRLRISQYKIKHHNNLVQKRIKQIKDSGLYEVFRIEWRGDFKFLLKQEKLFIEKYRKTILNSKMKKELINNEVTFLLRIDKDLKINAEYIAKKSERSLNWYINSLIKADLAKK